MRISEETLATSGRSLATFADFAKVSNLTPQKWIIKRRLEAPYARPDKTRQEESDGKPVRMWFQEPVAFLQDTRRLMVSLLHGDELQDKTVWASQQSCCGNNARTFVSETGKTCRLSWKCRNPPNRMKTKVASLALTDFNFFRSAAKSQVKNPTDCRTRRARRIFPEFAMPERWYSFRGSVEPEQSVLPATVPS